MSLACQCSGQSHGCAEVHRVLAEQGLADLEDALRGALRVGDACWELGWLRSVSDADLREMGVKVGTRKRFLRVLAGAGTGHPPPLPEGFDHPACSALAEVPADWATAGRVAGAPPELYYIPDVVTEEAERQLLGCVADGRYAEAGKWVRLRTRRLQEWGGVPVIGQGRVHPETLPPWLRAFCDSLSGMDLWGGSHANHVLVNEYDLGAGIMPHSDGPAYHPATAILSLAADAVFKLEPSKAMRDRGTEEREVRLLLRRRSLLVFRGSAYTDWEHSVPESQPGWCEHLGTLANASAASAESGQRERCESRRVSLTIRYVP
eukprot:TRINITY_DN16537_c0_g1_i1.p1 TRINITY_DN16537_c0_g1~~TRINITY_DN16537_c0_g1_i1.p1  ORF type:complete len:340 (+),score=98.82 TRINITY_DN16537_c0_g1_i1:63-1022(+)